MIKPDAVSRGMVSCIIERFLVAGFTIDKMDCVYAKESQIVKMYLNNICENGTIYKTNIIKYLSNNVVIPMHLKYNGDADALYKARKMIGYFDPKNAEPGTIRYDFGIDSLQRAQRENRCCHNLIHAASNYSEYRLDMKIWFQY